ncbi:MAG: DUF1343 domain-containing protein [Candidatus Marinimicrobia bacterium]|nr:DUF1343 domain-containing protein [Candidatus Neomarinimicrobiota bacterium]MBT3501699.1 DUF1343 domain-containing protein [Candidatus Neomarinimicrobiota bacterium]MBT3839716.1 DUF1343 domain-containing protein [Candidatus Neomarinimicrobiota bacterium]MBT3999084.1 DUF1343 domain-containing protein [Candidatus Neomarinimicrobiota bacterium]MBT4282341.1 DUF1343 domain-containing protein [Candidatus Neomarinimicrobiota bacterium]
MKKTDRYLPYIMLVLLLITSCSQAPKLVIKHEFSINKVSEVKTGIENLEDNGFKPLKNKRVGLIANATGVNRKLRSTIDILFQSDDVNLVALFGPEHGVRGNYSAGEKVSSSIDDETKLPVFALYGKTRKPTPEMLKNIDVLVYDIQDIGCRSYTYISTMGLAMEAAAENNIEFIVLDRPNPLGGIKIEGNIVEKGFQSFVSQFPIPYVYGLTVGELAQLINEENMLSNGLKCNLTVISMDGWKRSMLFKDTGLPWVPTSSHIPNSSTPIFYVSTGILGELGVLSNGVGYTLPFQLIGGSWIESNQIANELNLLDLEGVVFKPITYKPYYALGKNSHLTGVQLYFEDPLKVNLMSLQFLFMEIHQKYYPEKSPFSLADPSRLNMFDKVMGTSKVRELFSVNYKYSDIKSYLEKDIDSFRKMSRKYYLYEKD